MFTLYAKNSRNVNSVPSSVNYPKNDGISVSVNQTLRRTFTMHKMRRKPTSLNDTYKSYKNPSLELLFN